MWWMGFRIGPSAGVVAITLVSCGIWWALWATGLLFAASMGMALVLLIAAGVGLERGHDRRMWAYVMLAALATLLIGVLAQ